MLSLSSTSVLKRAEKTVSTRFYFFGTFLSCHRARSSLHDVKGRSFYRDE